MWMIIKLQINLGERKENLLQNRNRTTTKKVYRSPEYNLVNQNLNCVKSRRKIRG